MANLQISPQVLGALSNFGASDRIGDAIETRMLREAELRKEKEQTERLNAAIDITGKGVAAAQSGNVSGLKSQIETLREAIKTAPLAEKQFLIEEMRRLNDLLPGATNISIDNSVNAALAIDARLKDQEALRAAMPNLTEDQFNQAVQSLKANRDNLLLDPRVTDNYNVRAAAVRRADREVEDLKHEDYVSKNSAGLEAAIRDGDTDRVQSFITGAGPRYADDAQQYVGLITGNIETMQRLEQNSIAMTQEPNLELYKSQIDQFESEEVRRILGPALAEYEKAIESGWNAEKGQWTTNGRARAEQAEALLRSQINSVGMSDLASQMADRRARARTLDQQIDQQEAILDLVNPTQQTMEAARRIADAMAERTSGGRIKRAPTEAQINQIAEQLLRREQENARARLNQLYEERYPDDENRPEAKADVGATKDDGGYSTKINGNVTTRKMIADALETQSERQVKSKLRNSGASEQQIDALFDGL